MFGVLIVSKPEGASLARQTVVAVLDGKSRVFSRYTNGKQGRGNAWFDEAVEFETGDRVQVGNIVSVTVSPKDEEEWRAGLPSVLFQKLLRAHSLQQQDEVEAEVDEVIRLAIHLGDTDPAELRRWYSDGRGRKPAQKPVEAPVAVAAPLVAVSHRPAGEAVAAMLSVPSLDNPEIAGYIERVHAGGVTDFEALDFCREHGMNLSIEGEAGTGKSTLPMAYAANRGLNFWSMPTNAGMVIDQVFGGVNLTTGRWEAGYFTHIWEHGGVIELGEMTGMSPRIAMQLHPALDARRQLIISDGGYQRVIDAHPDLLIVGTYNPHYRGTTEMNQAFKDRFGMKMVFEYDSSIEKRILKSESLVDLAQRMRGASSIDAGYASAGVSYETPISTRLFKNFEKIALGLGYDFAVECFVNNFLADERPSVKTLLKGLAYNIQSDLALLEDDILTSVEEEEPTPLFTASF